MRWILQKMWLWIVLHNLVIHHFWIVGLQWIFQIQNYVTGQLQMLCVRKNLIKTTNWIWIMFSVQMINTPHWTQSVIYMYLRKAQILLLIWILIIYRETEPGTLIYKYGIHCLMLWILLFRERQWLSVKVMRSITIMCNLWSVNQTSTSQAVRYVTKINQMV